jgi:hypothetical protein
LASEAAPPWLIEKLARWHDRAAFDFRFGFVSLADDPNHLYLPMHTVRKQALPPLGTGP